MAYAQLDRLTEAVAAYQQAIHLKPGFAEAHSNLGLACLMLGDKGSALEEYDSLKSLNHDLANKLFNLIHQ